MSMRRWAKWIGHVVVLRAKVPVAVRIQAVEIEPSGSMVWYWATYA